MEPQVARSADGGGESRLPPRQHDNGICDPTSSPKKESHIGQIDHRSHLILPVFDGRYISR